MALGGIVLCARYQGNIHGAGMRMMLIPAAILSVAGAVLLVTWDWYLIENHRLSPGTPSGQRLTLTLVR